MLTDGIHRVEDLNVVIADGRVVKVVLYNANSDGELVPNYVPYQVYRWGRWERVSDLSPSGFRKALSRNYIKLEV